MQRVTAVKDGRRDCSTSSASQEDANRREQDDETGTQVSKSPSVLSLVSAVTTLHSHPSSNKYKRAGLSDDLQSDVPAISESIADMEDLAELTFSREVTPNQQRGSSKSVASPLQTAIDNRQHPLAPSNAVESTTLVSNCSQLPACGDLGIWSDAPSVYDDVSVVSAQSECFVGLRRTFRAPGSPCGSPEADMVPDVPSQQSIADSSGKGGQLWRRTGATAGAGKLDRPNHSAVLPEAGAYTERGSSGSFPEMCVARSFQCVTPDAWCLETCDNEKC